MLLEKFQNSHPPEKFTFPEQSPSKKIDYILISKSSNPKIKWTKVYSENQHADHLPIAPQFELNPIDLLSNQPPPSPLLKQVGE